MNLSDAALKVIELARKIRDYYDGELPKWHPHYPLIGPDEKTPPPPPEETELTDFLASLSEDVIYQLVLITDLGRGDLGVEDIAEHYEAVKLVSPAQAASQMLLFKATLADELADGLEELRKHKINVNRMPFKKVMARKR